jgi:hypothetical protein
VARDVADEADQPAVAEAALLHAVARHSLPEEEEAISVVQFDGLGDNNIKMVMMRCLRNSYPG